MLKQVQHDGFGVGYLVIQIKGLQIKWCIVIIDCRVIILLSNL